jgi:hypothetical protein
MDLENIHVPVILKNQLTQTTKQCFIVAGFHGILFLLIKNKYIISFN